MTETVQHTATEGGLSIHLAPEILGYFHTIPLTNTLFTTMVVACGLIVCAFVLRNSYRLVPSRAQVCLELLIGGAYEYVSETLENQKLADKVFPILMTVFIFILAINWVGLLPGVDSIGYYIKEGGVTSLVPFLHPGNTDLNITIAFALIAFFTIEVAGVALLGFFKYAGKFITFTSPLAFIIGLIELIGEIARLVSFSFRLFGNVFAGKTLLLVALFFVPFVVPVPILAFEVFVGFIQALVFSVLTLFFIKLAVASHGEAH